MTQQLISRIFRKEIINISAYKVVESENLIKLDAMENPYTWPKNVKEEWLNQLKDSPINRYPDPEAKHLVEIIRETNNIPLQSKILLGNGSDEIIQLLLMALPTGSTVLSPAPGFVMYRQVALSLGLDYKSVNLSTDNFELDISAMLEAIQKHQPLIIFLAYPNNPTGNLFNENSIDQILKVAPGLVILDEAYAPFANASFIDKLAEYKNLLVMRTLSKLGLAGLRLGFIAGEKDIIQQLNKIRLPYNINVLTQKTAEFALQNQELFNQQTQQICEDRSLVLAQLNKLPGITAFNSAANFILYKTPKKQADTIFERLKTSGILIKNLSPQGGLLNDCLRVTVGKQEENKAFVTALTKILSDLP